MFRFVFLIMLSSLLLIGCQTPQQPGPEVTQGPDQQSGLATTETLEPGAIKDGEFLTPKEEEIIAAFDLETAGEWLQASVKYQQLANNAVQPERSAFLLRAALMYYRAEYYFIIDEYFERMDETDLVGDDLLYREVIKAGGYFGLGKMYQALVNLPEIDDIVDYRFKALALQIRAKAVLAIGKPLESAELRMQISRFLRTDEEKEENHLFVWEALNRINENRILSALSEQQTLEVRGWLELNLIARRSDMLPAKMEPWVERWFELYGEHPAAIRFTPKLLEDSRRMFIKPTRIAVMLPLSGRLKAVSEAIQNGFLYAYYGDNDKSADITIIDASEDPAEFNLQYLQAVEQGADFIVGPLDKDLVDILQEKEALPVPTLTLNYGNSTKTTDNLFQFGLSPEDEAEQIADYALSEGHYFSAMLTPDTEWGDRLALAFSRRFEQLGGQIVGQSRYPARDNDYSQAIRNLLNLTNSEQRKSILQRTLGEEIGYEPRRRQDIDMIFIAANSRQARQIKPQLEFHRAQTLPVYATSHISSSEIDSVKDRDLDDILFVDAPWMLERTNNPEFASINELWPNSVQRFGRLYALGMDAYRIIPSLRRLLVKPEESVVLNTGELTVEQTGWVRRSLVLATYQRGLPRDVSAD